MQQKPDQGKQEIAEVAELVDLPAGRQARPDYAEANPDYVGVNWTQNTACPVSRDLAYPTESPSFDFKMFVVYVLRSLKDLKFYVGMTRDLALRLKKHEAGGVPSTRNRRPLELVYQESCATRQEARRREKFLKSGPGHAFIRNLIAAKA